MASIITNSTDPDVSSWFSKRHSFFSYFKSVMIRVKLDREVHGCTATD